MHVHIIKNKASQVCVEYAAIIPVCCHGSKAPGGRSNRSQEGESKLGILKTKIDTPNILKKTAPARKATEGFCRYGSP